MKRRSTKQREIVYEALMRLYHPTAEEVYEYLRGEFPTIGRATVFRNLAVLAEEGRIVKLSSPTRWRITTQLPTVITTLFANGAQKLSICRPMNGLLCPSATTLKLRHRKSISTVDAESVNKFYNLKKF